MSLSLDFWQLVSMAFGLIGAWLGFAKLFFAQVDRRLDERFNEYEKRMIDLSGWLKRHAEDEEHSMRSLANETKSHGERIARLESGSGNHPTHADIAQIQTRVSEINGAIQRLEGEAAAQTRILNLVYESLVK